MTGFLKHKIRIISLSYLFLLLAACSESKQVVSSKDIKALKSHSGYYVDQQLLEELRKTRLWNIPNFLSAVHIGKNGDSVYNFSWHEASTFTEWSEQRLIFQGQAFQFEEKEFSPSRFIRVADQVQDSSGYVDTYDSIFFKIIFEGCFLDQSNRKWCFSKKNISINNKNSNARLVLDRAELPSEGNVVDVENEKLFWVFKPEKDGWLVLKSDYVTKGDGKPLNWKKPWIKLRPL
jgi:hypothetical protein